MRDYENDIEPRARRVREFARRHGTSVTTLKRAISHDLLKCVYIGRYQIIPAVEDERVARDGLPNIPRGYVRQTTGPIPLPSPVHKKGFHKRAPSAKKAKAAPRPKAKRT
ncbi:hypothetical protein SAMN02990966_06490 [Rhodospirillales bacterium URHD0017]|nr:hypothetical protein SAMN02990966_06490 [Rhodospirillales bacterium URHD0017]